ncbi:hypothetical protein CSUB01_12179 [Colletotrichum sublineola]|uniref:Tat pathway signal sequence n=1 Tax=Colletotrichum sublineola TaxID=1173701 RepID=A0A066XW33_COLSU|nr:hypothetical protein CSUB01_12179 [Colletotrichum sublineola]
MSLSHGLFKPKEATNTMGEEQAFEEESDGLLMKPETLQYKGRRWSSLARYSTFISFSLNIIFTCLGLVYWIRAEYTTPSSYETGFDSDLEGIKSQIRLKHYDFAGGVQLDDSGKFFTDNDGHEYIAAPSPQVDDAWERLLIGLNIDLKEPGASVSEKTFQWPESGLYFTGLEVFHSLHCLNRLRQALYPDYYYDVFNNPDDPSREDHIGVYQKQPFGNYSQVHVLMNGRPLHQPPAASNTVPQ